MKFPPPVEFLGVIEISFSSNDAQTQRQKITTFQVCNCSITKLAPSLDEDGVY